LRQFTADLLPLAVAEKTLDSNMNLQIVAIDFARRYFEQQCFGASRYQFSRRLSTAGLAHVNGLVRADIPVRQRDDPMRDGFLNLGGSPALETGPVRGLRFGPDAGGADDPLPPVLLHTHHL
jgi:hypothetical protein